MESPGVSKNWRIELKFERKKLSSRNLWIEDRTDGDSSIKPSNMTYINQYIRLSPVNLNETISDRIKFCLSVF